MSSIKSMQFKSRVASFGFAARGILTLFLREPNAKLHALATGAVIGAGLWKGLRPGQWALLVLAIGLVWLAEALNTGLELLCDLVVDRKWHPVVKHIKDIAAGGVLIAALVAAIVGLLVFTA